MMKLNWVKDHYGFVADTESGLRYIIFDLARSGGYGPGFGACYRLPQGRSRHPKERINLGHFDSLQPAQAACARHAEAAPVKPASKPRHRNVTSSSPLQSFSIEDMRRFAGEAWGPLGGRIVDQWSAFNVKYFDGVLRPVPLVITNTQPFGHRLGFCSYNASTHGRSITLNVPAKHDKLVADYNTLLHEMLHQFLFERGEYPSHDGAPWRREIMRLTKLIRGTDIWAGVSKTVRQDGKVVRMNAPSQAGIASLPQKLIARWPHDGLGIDLGRFGSAHE